jgi:hypothetical protein
MTKHTLGCCADRSCTDETCMKLPDGTTCGNCAHIRRCLAFGFSDSEKQSTCDFFPRRFLPAAPPRIVAHSANDFAPSSRSSAGGSR